MEIVFWMSGRCVVNVTKARLAVINKTIIVIFQNLENLFETRFCHMHICSLEALLVAINWLCENKRAKKYRIISWKQRKSNT